LIAALFAELPFGAGPMTTGQAILAQAPQTTGAANNVTSVVLAYRGLDTLAELSILFVAATAAGLVLGRAQAPRPIQDGGFILRTAADLLFPFLLLLGIYIISHGHLTPGGGFQGGVILAVAFFLPLLAGTKHHLSEKAISIVEGLAGVSFVGIGLLSLTHHGHFLAPLLGQGKLGELFSAGSLPLLYIAVGIKVGSEMAGLMARLLQDEDELA
jgi:multicomponent Na+:H+ antiporter subunit B